MTVTSKTAGASQPVRRQVEFLAIGAGTGAALAILSVDGASGWSLALGIGCFLLLVVLYGGLQVLEVLGNDKSILLRTAVSAGPADERLETPSASRHAQDIEALAQEVRSTTAEAALGTEVAWQLVSGIATISAVLQSASPQRYAASPVAGSLTGSDVDHNSTNALLSTMTAAINQAVEELGHLGRVANAAAARKAA